MGQDKEEEKGKEEIRKDKTNKKEGGTKGRIRRMKRNVKEKQRKKGEKIQRERKGSERRR